MAAPKREPPAVNEADAAPPAGGAGAALDAALGEDEPADVEALVDEAAAEDEPDKLADVTVALPERLESEAVGPTALALTVETWPVMVARLLTMLATGVARLELAAEGEADGWLINCAWMRISSHCSPIHSS